MELQRERLERMATKPRECRGVEISKVAVAIAQDHIGEDREWRYEWDPAVVGDFVFGSRGQDCKSRDARDRQDNRYHLYLGEMTANGKEEAAALLALKCLGDPNEEYTANRADEDDIAVELQSKTPFLDVPVYITCFLQCGEYSFEHSRRSDQRRDKTSRYQDFCHQKDDVVVARPLELHGEVDNKIPECDERGKVIK